MIFHTLSQRLTIIFIHHKIIPLEDKEIYIYSFELLLSAIVNLAVAAFMMAITRQVLGGITFMMVFLILRQSVGGYHAPTHFRCILSFSILFSVFLSVLIFLPAYDRMPFVLIALFFAVPVSVWCAPVAHANKPLSEAEKQRLGRMAKLSVLVLTLLIIIGIYFFPENSLSFSAALSMSAVAISAILGTLS